MKKKKQWNGAVQARFAPSPEDDSDEFDPKNCAYEGPPLVFDRANNRMVLPEELPVSENPDFKFLQLPVKGFGNLCVLKRDATWAVLFHLADIHFSDRWHRNPLVLKQTRIKEFKVSKGQKARALSELQAAGLISVERRPRKSPIVTLNWLPLVKFGSLGEPD